MFLRLRGAGVYRATLRLPRRARGRWAIVLRLPGAARPAATARLRVR